MIKNILFASLLSMSSASLLLAQEHHAKPGEFYVVAKALMTTSETFEESEHSTLKSEIGGGVGVDIGYTLPHHFAVELDTSYAKNSVEEHSNENASQSALASYWTYAFDVTYTLPLSHVFGIMGKVGYEFEHESIDALHIEGDDSGLVYGGALEYHMSEHYEALFEYEQSTIESPRGASLYAGLKYIF